MADILSLFIWLLEKTPYGEEYWHWAVINYIVYAVIGWQILYRLGIMGKLLKLLCKILGCDGEIKLQHKPVKQHDIQALKKEISKQGLTIASLQVNIENMKKEIQNKKDKNIII